MKLNRISKSQYENLKKNYLQKNRCMYSLYLELYQETKIDKQIFFRLINKIRKEEGYAPLYDFSDHTKNINKNTNKDEPYQYST